MDQACHVINASRCHALEPPFAFHPVEEGGQLLLAVLPIQHQLPKLAEAGDGPPEPEVLPALTEVRTHPSSYCWGCVQGPHRVVQKLLAVCCGAAPTQPQQQRTSLHVSSGFGAVLTIDPPVACSLLTACAAACSISDAASFWCLPICRRRARQCLSSFWRRCACCSHETACPQCWCPSFRTTLQPLQSAGVAREQPSLKGGSSCHSRACLCAERHVPEVAPLLCMPGSCRPASALAHLSLQPRSLACASPSGRPCRGLELHAEPDSQDGPTERLPFELLAVLPLRDLLNLYSFLCTWLMDTFAAGPVDLHPAVEVRGPVAGLQGLPTQAAFDTPPAGWHFFRVFCAPGGFTNLPPPWPRLVHPSSHGPRGRVLPLGAAAQSPNLLSARHALQAAVIRAVSGGQLSPPPVAPPPLGSQPRAAAASRQASLLTVTTLGLCQMVGQAERWAQPTGLLGDIIRPTWPNRRLPQQMPPAANCAEALAGRASGYAAALQAAADSLDAMFDRDERGVVRTCRGCWVWAG